MRSSEKTLPSGPAQPAAQVRRTSPYAAAWAVLGLFVLLALVLTWPLAAHLSTRLPGTATWAFDESTFAWNIWYFKHALLDLQTSPLHSNLIWFPLGIDLILYTYNFFNALIALPLQLAGNVPLASNITLLLATVLSGIGTYLLARYLLGDSVRARRLTRRDAVLAAFVAGIIYAFASNRAVYAALGHYDMVTTQWLPFYALYLVKTLREPRLKNALLAGLFFALAALAEMIFASFLALFSLIILVALWRSLRLRWAALGRLVIAAVVAGVLWLPVLLPVAREFTRGDYALEGWGESIKLSADLVGLVTPTALNPLLRAEGDWQPALRAVEEGKGRFGDINTVFLGWVTLALALVGAWVGRRRVAAWAWSALVFGILALGPLLQVNGRFRFSLDGLLPEGVTFPLPFALLHFIPVINGNRAPNRNSVILMLALAVLAAYAVGWLLSHRGHRGNREVDVSLGTAAASEGKHSTRSSLQNSMFSVLSVATIVILILTEHLAAPLPTTDARVPAVYENIAASRDEFTILQLPLGWRNSFGVFGSEQTNLQYFQTDHGKAMLGGNISRAPDFKMDYFKRIPLFQALTALEMYENVPPEVDAAARAQAGELMALYNVRYFITTPPIAGRYPYQDTWQRTEAYAFDVLPLEDEPLWEADGYRVYRVEQPTVPFPFRLDAGTPGTEPYLGAGWDLALAEQPYGATASWATGQTAYLYLPMPQDRCTSDFCIAGGAYPLKVHIAPLAYDGAAPQSVSFYVNGKQMGLAHPLNPGWQTIEQWVAGLHCGSNTIEMRFDWAVSPRTAFPDATSRAVIGATDITSPVNLDVHAFSEAYITATAADGAAIDASAGRAGYNVAVLDERTGALLDKAGFDTTANTHEADRLAAYLQRIPAGRIVVLATKGAATANLTPAAVAALRGVGSAVAGVDELAGQAHALVGVQGGPPGSAAEAIAPDAFIRVAGDFRTLAAAVDWVELGR